MNDVTGKGGKTLRSHAVLLDDAAEPLLDPAGHDGDNVHGRPLSGAPVLHEAQLVLEDCNASKGCTSSQAVFNLANTIVGAGMMALPRVTTTLGIAGGLVSMAAVYCLAYYSLCAVVRAAELTGSHSYPDMVGLCFGKAGRTMLQLAIIICNGGMMIVYINIITSSLSDPVAGLLPELLPTFRGSYLLDSHIVAAIMVLFVLLPLCCLRNLKRLGDASIISIMISYAFALSLLSLASAAAWQGLLPAPLWVPKFEVKGKSFYQVLSAMVLTIPITSLSFICHMNLLPLKNALQSYTQRRLLNVVQTTLAITTVLYLIVSISGCLLFGKDTQENILMNISKDVLTPIVGAMAAPIIVMATQLAYLLVLVLTFPLVNWAVREVTVEMLLGRSPLSPTGWYALTSVMQLVMYLIAVLVPSIWKVLEVSGATAGMLIGYFFPGLLILRVGPSANKRRRVAAAYTMLTVGAVLAVLTMLKPFISNE